MGEIVPQRPKEIQRHVLLDAFSQWFGWVGGAVSVLFTVVGISCSFSKQSPSPGWFFIPAALAVFVVLTIALVRERTMRRTEWTAFEHTLDENKATVRRRLNEHRLDMMKSIVLQWRDRTKDSGLLGADAWFDDGSEDPPWIDEMYDGLAETGSIHWCMPIIKHRLKELGETWDPEEEWRYHIGQHE